VTGAANVLYAVGRDDAIGFSAFGVDDQGNAPLDLVGITNSAERVDSSALGSIYLTLSRLESLLLKGQETGGLSAALLEGEAQRAARSSVGEYTANIVRMGGPAASGVRAGALFIQTGANEFLVIGSGDAVVTFSADTPGLPFVGIESIDEEFFQNDAWTPRRRLNGDENSQGQALRLHASDAAQGRIYRVRLYRYK
jgi:hypothetical protein